MNISNFTSKVEELLSNIDDNDNVLFVDLVSFTSNNVITIESDDVFKNGVNELVKRYCDRSKDKPRKIYLRHGLESDPIIINGEWIFKYIHQLVNLNEVLQEDELYFISGNWSIVEVYNNWHRDNLPNTSKINVEGIFELQRLYAPKLMDHENKWKKIVKLDYVTEYKIQHKEKYFLTLNRSPKDHRMDLYRVLDNNNLIEKGFCSWNEINERYTYFGSLTDEQMNKLPIHLDMEEGRYNSANEYIYNVTMPQAFSFMPDKEYDVIPNYFAEYFNNSYFSVVTETKFGIPKSDYNHCTNIINDINCMGTGYYDINTNKTNCMVCNYELNTPNWMNYYIESFITEKTWRNMLNMHPTIWLGTPYTTNILKHFGFKTFNTVWDESYDQITHPKERFYAVINLIKQLCDKTHDEWLELQEKLLPILKHNQNIMLEIDKTMTTTQENYLKYGE